MGFLDKLTARGRMDDPVRGSAQVVACSGYTGEGTWESCSMQLVVQAENVPATSVELNPMVKRDRWPSPGMTLPVTVDRSDPQRVKVEWDEVESSDDRAKRSAEAMAAAMRGEQPAGGGLGGGLGGGQVINLSGKDLSQLSDEQRAKLEMLGIDPATLGATAPPTPPPADDEDEVDERLAQLERLAKLHEQGVLTDVELAEQKEQILGD